MQTILSRYAVVLPIDHLHISKIIRFAGCFFTLRDIKRILFWFTYLQMIRKLYSNTLSFLLILLDWELSPQPRRNGNNSHRKGYEINRIILESNGLWIGKYHKFILLTYHAFITINKIRTTNNRPPPRPIISSEIKTSTLS